MGKYTMSLREIIQRNNKDGLPLTIHSNIKTIAETCIYNDLIGLNAISDKYREAFKQGFVMHFFNEEIGLETLPLWKIAFDEKLINNAANKSFEQWHLFYFCIGLC